MKKYIAWKNLQRIKMVLTQKSPLVIPRNRNPSSKDERKIKNEDLKKEPAYEVRGRQNVYCQTLWLHVAFFLVDIAPARQRKMPHSTQRHTRRRSHSDREAPHQHAWLCLQVRVTGKHGSTDRRVIIGNIDWLVGLVVDFKHQNERICSWLSLVLSCDPVIGSNFSHAVDFLPHLF